MNSVKIFIDNKEVLVNKNENLYNISRSFTDSFNDEIIIAKVNNEYKELNYTVKGGEEIEFFDLHQKEANRVYLNGLLFLLGFTFKKIFNTEIIVRHSIDKGIYINTDIKIDEKKLLKVEEKMNTIVNGNVKIDKLTISRLNAFSYFDSCKKNEKRDNLLYNTNSFLTMYRLGDYYDFMYSLMPISTGCLKYFRFTLLNDHGFVLTYPTIYMDNDIEEYTHRENVFNLFKENHEFLARQGINYVCDLNKMISYGKINDLILIDELNKNNKLVTISEEIASNKKVKIILIAGPSSSGKTTTTNKLVLSLRSLGKKPVMISMDDFYLERVDNPKDKDGNYDYECLESIDLKLFNKTIEKLLNYEKVKMPEYNFINGKKEFKKEMQIDENTIILIEGIHAMNPKLLDRIDKEKKVKIYLSPLSDLNIDRNVKMSTTDDRLLRRIVRDYRTRGKSVEDTLNLWKKVREGEEKYIFPYQDDADYTINTSIIYEIGVLKVYVEPLLYSVDINSSHYEEAKRLVNFLRLFLPIASEKVPIDSVLREFIGGGCFKI